MSGNVVGKNSMYVAEYFILNSPVPLTPIQINKFVYISHGLKLAMYSKPLICEEVEAWRYGPVIPSIYHTLKKFKRGTIDPKEYPSPTIKYEEYRSDNAKLFDTKEIEIMQIVLKVYSSLPISKLIGITHKKNGPWHQWYDKNKSFIGIPDETIKTYYKKVINND